MDERVTAAISNWSPRFIANGIDHSDFARVTATIERWDQWCAAWCAAGAEHEELGRAALADGRGQSAGTDLAQAAAYYHFAKFVFMQDPAQMRAAHERAVRCLTDALPHLDPPGERVVIPFDGAELVGNLRRPGGPGPHPVVILIPGLDSTKEEFGATEQLFLDHGLATFSVDGPGQGEAEYDLPIRPDWEVPGAAIIDAVTALPGIDPGRVGHLGREPRRLLRLPADFRRRPGPGLHRARRPLRLRRVLGGAPPAHPRGLSVPVQGRQRRGRRAQGPRADHGRAARHAAGPAAGRHGPAGPPVPLAAGRAPGGRGRRPGRADAARAGQPRLRQRGLPAPALQRRLDGPPPRRLRRLRHRIRAVRLVRARTRRASTPSIRCCRSGATRCCRPGATRLLLLSDRSRPLLAVIRSGCYCSACWARIRRPWCRRCARAAGRRGRCAARTPRSCGP